MKKILKHIFLLLLLASSLYAGAEGGIAVLNGTVPISMKTAQGLLGKPGVYFYDVNGKQRRDKYGYLKDSIPLPLENWESVLPKNKKAILVFYGQNRLTYGASRTALAASKLGYKKVYVMLDGLDKWVLSGRPVVRDNILDWENSKGIEGYADTVHDKLIFGEMPSCRSCHAQKGKAIRPDLAGNLNLINQNCASCHKKEEKEFLHSAHGSLIELSVSEVANKKMPSCASCHLIHKSKLNSGVGNVKVIAAKRCEECHEKQGHFFKETFHGKALALHIDDKAVKVASCYDCHGKHGIYKDTLAQSTLWGPNKIKTCSECHPGANASFVEFRAHADHSDRVHFPVLYWAFIAMTCLIVAVFVFFGLHTLLWSIKLIMLRLKHPVEFKAAKKKAHEDKLILRRFSTLHRIQHFFMAGSFLVLALSGLPQKYFESDWADSIIAFLGGPIMATKVHHTAAIVMFVVFFSHIAEVMIRSYTRRDCVRDEDGKLSFKLMMNALFGPDSLMPNMQDLRDMKAHVKWFFGKGPRPQFDRWTYWEKFDYLAVFWGMFVIGISGLMLWFPVAFTKVLPGWSLNLATLIHSDEALLATGFIFAIHFFNTHFRADRFPMDMVIFSGTLSDAEMQAERSLWHDRLKKEGRFDKMVEKDSKFKYYSWIARLAGFVMLAAGLVFLILIIYAYLA